MRVTPRRLAIAVAARTKLPLELLLPERRTSNGRHHGTLLTTRYRHVMYFVAMRKTPPSYGRDSVLARGFGVDRTTLYHAHASVSARLRARDPEFIAKYRVVIRAWLMVQHDQERVANRIRALVAA